MSTPVAAYHERVLKKVGFTPKPGMRVLDVGCGDGDVTFFLGASGCLAVGGDIAISPQWRSQVGSRTAFVRFDSRFLPFRDRIFDVVYVKDTLHHQERPDLAISEAIRVTSGGGHVVVVEANRYHPIGYVHLTLLGGHNHFTREQFVRLISSARYPSSFRSFEAHVIPGHWQALQRFAESLQNIWERAPLLRYFSNYNAAIICKADASTSLAVGK